MGRWSRPHRLKKEALPFFKEDLARSTHSIEEWKRIYNVDENALEEIKEPVITCGENRYNKDGTPLSSTLGGWENPENAESKRNDRIGGTHYCFTIHFPSVKWEEYDRFMKGRMVRELLDRLQHEADMYFLDFIDNFSKDKKEDEK